MYLHDCAQLLLVNKTIIVKIITLECELQLLFRRSSHMHVEHDEVFVQMNNLLKK